MKDETSRLVKRIDKRKVKKCKNPNFEMQCIECGQTFYAVRRTAKYCSDYCKNVHAENVKNRIANAKYKVGDIVNITYDTKITEENISDILVFKYKVIAINSNGYECQSYNISTQTTYGRTKVEDFATFEKYVERAMKYIDLCKKLKINPWEK